MHKPRTYLTKSKKTEMIGKITVISIVVIIILYVIIKGVKNKIENENVNLELKHAKSEEHELYEDIESQDRLTWQNVYRFTGAGTSKIQYFSKIHIEGKVICFGCGQKFPINIQYSWRSDHSLRCPNCQSSMRLVSYETDEDMKKFWLLFACHEYSGNKEKPYPDLIAEKVNIQKIYLTSSRF